MLNYKKDDSEKIDIREKSNLELKNKMITELQKFKEFNNRLIEKIKMEDDLQKSNFEKKNFKPI